MESQAEQDARAAAINVCLETDLAFKLYSYRITTPEQFMGRVKDLCEYFIESTKLADNSNLKIAEDE